MRVELDILIINKLGAEALVDVDDLIEEAGIQVEAVTGAHWMLTRQTYFAFDKGLGHPAQPNLGDCFSYAPAEELHMHQPS